MLPRAPSPTGNRHAVWLRQICRPIAALLLLCMASAAQQPAQTGTGSDARSASAQPQAHADAGTQSEGSEIGVVSKTSWFFPNLATTSEPLTPGQKFELAARNSVSVSAFLSAGAGAGITQALDTPSGFGQGAEGYGKRFGAAMARTASSQMFGTFLLASALHQDPRFFVRTDLNFGGSVAYSIKRVFITRSDSGNNVFNWSGLLGALLAEGLANAYYPDSARTVGSSLERYGYDLGGMAAGNLLKQYWPKISHRLRLQPAAPAPATTNPSKP